MIKIGNLDISSFKVGSDDCKVYLGDILLYSGGTTPTKAASMASWTTGVNGIPDGWTVQDYNS